MTRHSGIRAVAVGVLLALCAPTHGSAQKPNVDNLVKQAQNDPNFDVEGTLNRLANDPSMSAGDLAKANDRLRAADKKRRDDQNASGQADWNMGMLYRGADYKLTFPLENHCRVAATVTITYPTSIPLSGPATVTIPAKSKVDVPMVVSFKNALQPPPPGPWPIGTNFQCVPESDSLKLSHPQAAGGKAVTPAGTYTYVCAAMERTFSMYLHLHYPPEGDDGGGGGASKPPMKKTCQNLWNYGEFRPMDPDRRTPNSCAAEIFNQMLTVFDQQLPGLQAKNPGAWSWLPSKDQLSGMSVEQLLSVKSRAAATALGK